MGMYTELVLGVDLKRDTPEIVIRTLKKMLSMKDEEEIELPDHELFKLSTGRWTFMLRCDSYYFAGTTNSEMHCDHITKRHELSVRCNLKNYEREIELFLDWIKPYVEDRGFAGYKRYEECDEPELIYFNRV